MLGNKFLLSQLGLILGYWCVSGLNIPYLGFINLLECLCVLFLLKLMDPCYNWVMKYWSKRSSPAIAWSFIMKLRENNRVLKKLRLLMLQHLIQVAHYPFYVSFYLMFVMMKFIIFIHPSLNLTVKNENVHLIKKKRPRSQKDFLGQLGLKQWLRKQGVEAKSIVSLQNTSLAYQKDIPKIIYLHQGLPLHAQKWSFLKRRERRLALYKYIYPLFIFTRR